MRQGLITVYPGCDTGAKSGVYNTTVYGTGKEGNARRGSRVGRTRGFGKTRKRTGERGGEEEREV